MRFVAIGDVYFNVERVDAIHVDGGKVYVWVAGTRIYAGKAVGATREEQSNHIVGVIRTIVREGSEVR